MTTFPFLECFAFLDFKAYLLSVSNAWYIVVAVSLPFFPFVVSYVDITLQWPPYIQSVHCFHL